jgi:CRP/FNR family transcriptional regulator, anaerobic regulatory protein
MKDKFGLILKNFAKLISLSSKEEELICSKLRIETIKAKTILLHTGEICTKSYFVNSGCLRSFTINEDGTEQTVNFAPKDWWISEMYSYISGEPAIQNIEAIEESEIIVIEKKDQDELYEKIPKLDRFFRILIEKSLVAQQKRLMANLSLSAEERYHLFAKRFPELVNTVPQKQIASYIGVTPEFFSKMKARILKRK